MCVRVWGGGVKHFLISQEFRFSFMILHAALAAVYSKHMTQN